MFLFIRSSCEFISTPFFAKSPTSRSRVTADVVRSHTHRPISGVAEVTASNVVTDVVKRQPLGDERHVWVWR